MTKRFSLDVIRYTQLMPKRQETVILSRQLLRSATSVGANYRAACRARSQAEFTSKLQIVLEEADECCYWLELLQESRIADTQQTQSLLREANQITAIMVAGLKIARKGKI